MSELYRIPEDRMMGPITGVRPDDDRWGGELPEEYINAILADTLSDDLPKILESMGVFSPDDLTDESLGNLLGSFAVMVACRTAQRLAVELDGCTIDTSTIFENEQVDAED